MNACLNELRRSIPEIPEETKVLPLSILYIDPEYQRELVQSEVDKIMARFDPFAIGVLLVAKRKNGKYAILDGQHRWTVLKELGVPRVICAILPNMTKAREAQVFIECNKNRKALTPYDKFNARLAQRDPVAHNILQIVKGLGIEIVSSSKGKSNAICAVAGLDRIMNMGGPALLISTITIIKSAWNGHRDSFRKDVLVGIARFLKKYEAKDVDMKRMQKQLSATPISEFCKMGNVKKAHMGAEVGFAMTVLELYNHKLMSNRLPNLFFNAE